MIIAKYKIFLTVFVSLTCLAGSLFAGDDIDIIKPVLGNKFGKVIRVTGKLKYFSNEKLKRSEPVVKVTVTKVDDKKLAKPVVIQIANGFLTKELAFNSLIEIAKHGTPVSLLGYETLFVSGIPDNLPEDTPLIQDTSYSIENYFVLLKIVSHPVQKMKSKDYKNSKSEQ